MSAGVAAVRRRVAVGVEETRKLRAFLRRDLLVMLSYRVAFAGDLLFIAAQAVLFYFIAQIVDPGRLPAYGGTPTTYMEFVMIGVVVTTVSGLLLQRVATAIREEQLMGTLEALLMSPTSVATVQAGSIAFDLLFVPVRMGVLLGAVALAFGLDFEIGGVIPALIVFGVFAPFVWGLGLAGAAATLTRRATPSRAALALQRPFSRAPAAGGSRGLAGDGNRRRRAVRGGHEPARGRRVGGARAPRPPRRPARRTLRGAAAAAPLVAPAGRAAVALADDRGP
jgi:hypothetical protein